MRTFTDIAGREWRIVLNVAQVKAVRDAVGINLCDLGTGDVADRLATDYVLLVDVLYILCKQQAQEAGVSPELFGESISADVLDKAQDAFIRELVDFFPSRRRAMFAGILAAIDQMPSDQLEAIASRIVTGCVSSLLESAELNRGPSPLENSPECPTPSNG